jgi:epoxyqueuosine reductase
MFNSQKCLSYQTIENRGDIDETVRDKLGNSIYGCDRCQQACPWNRFARPTDIPELQPREELLLMRRADWQQLTVEQYRALFRGSAVKRAKYEGLVRNIRAVSTSV